MLHSSLRRNLIWLAAPLVALVLCGCVTETTGPPHPTGKVDYKASAKINTELGLAYAAQGNLELAQTKLRKAVDQDDSLAQAHGGLAYVYWQLNNFEDARSEFHRAIDLDGDDPEIRNNYGAFLCSQGKYQDGDDNFMQALKHRDYATPAKAWTNAGLCARQAGDLERAETDLRRALQADPGFANALSEMATMDFQKENHLGCRAFLDRYQKVAQPSAKLLLLGFRNERALGNEDGAQQYSIKLVRSYPDSDEAAQLLKLRAPPT